MFNLASVTGTVSARPGCCDGRKSSGRSPPTALQMWAEWRRKVQAQDVAERSQLDEGQSGDLLHVLQGQVSNPRQAKPAFGDPKLLGREAETMEPCVGLAI
uniref:Uncharacterized protein n=1 Tax=Molossus molossus TaxID=27622 RepID=A0A7J8HI46_MOLMO|nr:hypothetical protein HJG59_010958 [Molossus molossus]